jgi:DNA-binding helix-hairpin-helix protein with protein kinase domain
VSLIDVDSIQINARNVVFPVSAFSPDYSSPELSTKGNSQPIQTSSDNFTLAIILYRIIVGIHPFMGTVRHRNGLAVQDAIAGGYYVHGRRKNDFEVIPPIHNRLMMAGREVREYFRYALDEGIFNPSIRPSASGWSKMLHEELHSNKFANRCL